MTNTKNNESCGCSVCLYRRRRLNVERAKRLVACWPESKRQAGQSFVDDLERQRRAQ